MSHVINSTQRGTGPGGDATSNVEWTPSHDLSPVEQIQRIQKAGRMLERLNDMLYAAPGTTAQPDG